MLIQPMDGTTQPKKELRPGFYRHPHPSAFSDRAASLRLHFNLAKPWDPVPQLRSQPFSTLRINDPSAGAAPLPFPACLQARALRHTPKQRRPWFLRTLRKEFPGWITVLELAWPKTIMKALFSSTDHKHECALNDFTNPPVRN